LKHLRHAPCKELSILALTLGLCLAGAGAAAETPAPLGPLGMIQSSVARVRGIAQASPAGSTERRTAILRVSHDLFDFNEIARRALGQHWKGLSSAEQGEFVQLFTDVLDRAFIASVDEYPHGNVTFLGESIDGTVARVRSRIIANDGTAISIDYRVHQHDARWAVYDVVSEDVSLVANYRSQLTSVIRTASVADVLERIRTDRLKRREPTTPAPLVPSRLAAGLLLSVLTRQAPQR
jgi:phospholipid transport system substrate-binding protein